MAKAQIPPAIIIANPIEMENLVSFLIAFLAA
jgi:hypothetical protein